MNDRTVPLIIFVIISLTLAYFLGFNLNTYVHSYAYSDPVEVIETTGITVILSAIWTAVISILLILDTNTTQNLKKQIKSNEERIKKLEHEIKRLEKTNDD